MKKLIILFVLMIITANIYSQTEVVTVTIQEPPQYKFNVAQMWDIILTNTTTNTYNVYLLGTAVKSGEGLIVEATTRQFTLRPGTKMISAAEIQPIDLKKNKDFESIISRTGNLPQGEYQICVNVISTDSNTTLGSKCYLHSIQNLSQVQIIAPLNGSDIQEMYPVFTWLPPTPVPPGSRNLNYTLSIYEVLSRQTPYNAVQSNPAFFQLEKIRQTVYRYPAVSRNFEGGKRYAVIVTALFENDIISESEVFDFTYTDSLYNNSSNKRFAFLNPVNHMSLSAASKLLKEKKKLLEFGGSANINFEASDNPGAYSKMKSVFGRIEVMPKVSLSGIPFGFDLFYATDQNGFKQNMNNFSFDFSADDLKSLLQEKVEDKLSEIREEVEKKITQAGEQFRNKIELQAKNEVMDKLPYPMKLFSQFENFVIGKNYPKYSDYILSGVSVTGLNFEINPGLFYIALTGPLNNKAIENTSYKRNLYSGRIGIGKKDDSHLYFSALYANDDNSSISDPDNPYLLPKENFVLGTEGNLTLLQNKLILEGELGVSMMTEDTQAPALIDKNIPEWAMNFFNPTMSSRVDGYYKIGTTYQNQITGTTIKANMFMVGPGYLSLGSPDKANDKLEFEIMADQKFLNNQIAAKVSFKTGRDNLLDGYKNYTTRNSLLNINLSLRFKNFPVVNVIYYPVLLKNNATDESTILDNINHNLSVFASHPLKIAGINNNVSLMFGLNSANTYKAKNNSYNWNLYLTDAISFNSPLFVSGSLGILRSGMTNSSYTLSSINTYSIDLNGGYTFFNVWQNSVGFNVTTSPGENRNITVFINSSARILDLFNLDMRLEKRAYNDMKIEGINYDDIIFKSTVSMDLK